jgi:hypothetical protein
METKKLTTEIIKKWQDQEPDEIHINSFIKKYHIDPEDNLVYQVFSRQARDGELKKLGRGWYRKVEPITPIKWWNGDMREALPIVHPYGIDDSSSFDFDGVEIFAGDTILVEGLTNMAKTAYALNFMVNNLHLFPATRLMVNEYKPIRFRKRMEHFTWADYWDEDKPKFEVIPVTKNHEDYVLRDAQNIVDWVLLRKDFWEIAGLIEDMQMKVGQGLLLVVLQRMPGHSEPMGGGWGGVLPALHVSIDRPFKLTVKKVKSYKGNNPEGKVYAFDIVDGGSKFHRIREVKNCPRCKGAYGNKYCQACLGKGFVEIE